MSDPTVEVTDVITEPGNVEIVYEFENDEGREVSYRSWVEDTETVFGPSDSDSTTLSLEVEDEFDHDWTVAQELTAVAEISWEDGNTPQLEWARMDFTVEPSQDPLEIEGGNLDLSQGTGGATVEDLSVETSGSETDEITYWVENGSNIVYGPWSITIQGGDTWTDHDAGYISLDEGDNNLELYASVRSLDEVVATEHVYVEEREDGGEDPPDDGEEEPPEDPNDPDERYDYINVAISGSGRLNQANVDVTFSNTYHESTSVSYNIEDEYSGDTVDSGSVTVGSLDQETVGIDLLYDNQEEINTEICVIIEENNMEDCVTVTIEAEEEPDQPDNGGDGTDQPDDGGDDPDSPDNGGDDPQQPDSGDGDSGIGGINGAVLGVGAGLAAALYGASSNDDQ